MPNKREESISLEESPIVSGMKEERKASLLGGGAGWSFEKSGYRVIERSKGVILPLDLGEYRFCSRGG